MKLLTKGEALVSEHKLNLFKKTNLAKGVALVSEHKLDLFRLCE